MTREPAEPAAATVGTLVGFTVALLRTPDRAQAAIEELARRGARVVLVPLIDWELPESTVELDSRLRSASSYDWIILTSGTTVRALAARARALGTGLADLLGEARVAAVGPATAAAVAELDVAVHCVPEEDQSAAGLLSVLPGSLPGTRVLLPQSNLAADTLRVGLAERGWSVDTVTAYVTVDHPARENRRVHGAGENSSATQPGVPVLTRKALVKAFQQGAVDAVVVSSPSIAERLHAMMKEVPEILAAGTGAAAPEVAIVAIGRRTERDSAALGLGVNAVAASPSPVGIADAVEAAVVGRLQPGNQPLPGKAGNPS